MADKRKSSDFKEAIQRLARLEMDVDTSDHVASERRTIDVAEAHERLARLRDELELYEER